MTTVNTRPTTPAPMTVEAATRSARHHVAVRGHDGPRYGEIITPQTLDFLRELHRRFTVQRHRLVDARLSASLATPGFLAETRAVREDDTWHVASPPAALATRRVEITGPVEPKLAINALTSGADVWMADFEDATSPTWANVVEGHLTLKDAVARTLTHTSEDGRSHSLGDDLATIVVRPRGWHLLERHLLVDAEPIPAALVDFGLFVFHNGRTLADLGEGPFLYLPKLEHHLEARLWNDIFDFSEQALGLARGTIRASVLIETVSAAFEMDEIMYELRDRVVALTEGRWDYIFSIIKQFGDDPRFVLPDRSAITMTVPFMAAFGEAVVSAAHRRGTLAIGGITAVSPGASPGATAAVRADTEREAAAGFDGALVSHPDLVAVARSAFVTATTEGSSSSEAVTSEALLSVDRTPGAITWTGLCGNVSVLVRYLHSWLRGHGALGWAGRPEDAATAEIARSQLWQWIRHFATLDDGRHVTAELVQSVLSRELDLLAQGDPEATPDQVAAIEDLVTYGALGDRLPTSITEYGYRRYLL